MRKADNLPLSCAVVTKSGNFNFQEPFGPAQASNGTALPLPLHFIDVACGFVTCGDLKEIQGSVRDVRIHRTSKYKPIGNQLIASDTECSRMQ